MIGTVAPRRLAAVRTALALGGYAVLVIEAAGAVGALHPATIVLAWMLAGSAAGAVVIRRRLARRAGSRDRDDRPGLVRAARAWWAATPRLDRFLLLAVVGLVLGELIVAVLAEPNNFDSQTYHLARIEHWVADGDVAFFPTAIHRQVNLAPGGEYLLTHLRLLTGSDALYNLVQWAMGMLCLLVAARIAAQLGGSRRAQLLTAFIVGTTPMVTLQASSTQVDLIVAGWVGCLATLVLDALRTPVDARTVVWLGVASGLAAVTKATGLLAVASLLLLWGLAQLRRAWATGPAYRSAARTARLAAGCLGILAVAALFVGPFLFRMHAEYGSIVGPPWLPKLLAMQRHDPAAILVNGLRVGHTALDTPLAPLSRASAGAVTGVAGLVGVDPQDPAMTFVAQTFPQVAWYPDEDLVSLPIQGALVLLGLVFCLVRARRFSDQPGALRAYAVTVAATGLLYVATVKWQPWGNRLILFLLVIGAPLAGLWLDRGLRRAWPARAVLATLLVAAVSATLAIGYGYPRRLVGAGSVVTTDPIETRFIRRPQWKDDYVEVGDAIAASGARTIGIVQQNNAWEYPWWVLLRGRRLVALQSVIPGVPPVDPASVDAIVCTGDLTVCRRLVPAGWTMVRHGYAGYALPPRMPRS